MTIEIDEKQVTEETADDLQVKAWINDKLEPDDEYSLNCIICNKNMMLQHNIHTNALLFQFYKCRCPITDRHVIVRDKRMSESVVYRSKGICHTDGRILTRSILSMIIHTNDQFHYISSLASEAVNDTRLELIVDRHMIDQYRIKYDDVQDEVTRFDKSGLFLNTGIYLEQLAKSGDITAVKHHIRSIESRLSCNSIMIWLNRLEYDTYESMMTPIISHMADFFVHGMADNEKNDLKTLIDIILSISNIVYDLCNKAIDEEYVMLRDVIDESYKLIRTLDDHDQITYAQFKMILKIFIDRLLLNIDATSYSMPCNLNVSSLDKYPYMSNFIESDLRNLAANVFMMILNRLVCRARMAKSALEIQEYKLTQKRFRDLLESHNYLQVQKSTRY